MGTNVNHQPVATGDSYTMDENTVGTFAVLTNDSDPDGDALIITAVTQGIHGTVTFTDTEVTYTPATEYVGF